MEPLAQRLRPRTLDEVCGQQHLLGKNQVFRRTVESGKIPNMIFYGPSGVGKTTVASIIAAGSGMQLHKLNGTTASTSDIKSVLADIGTLGASGGILLYLDEIQYFNKRQQQSLLECVEQGTVTLIASTTENPYFYVYNALLSRCTVFEFKSLTTDDIRAGLRSAAARLGAEDKSPVLIPDDALEYLAQSAGGDMRKALGNLEFAVTAAPAAWADATAGSRKPMFISCIKMTHQSTRINAHPPPHRRRYRSSTVRRLVSFRFSIGSQRPISFAAPPLPRPRAAWRGCF